MQIAGYLKTSLIEWPGKIVSVIFVPGCNFRCPFCHNRDLVEVQRSRQLSRAKVEGGAKVQRIKEAEIFADLEKRKKWVDGVVVTGGEPTLQPDLPEFLRKCQKLGFETMIETNGSRPNIMAKLLDGQMVDFVAMDFKGPIGEYGEYIGQKSKVKSQKYNSKVKSSMEIILKSGVECEFRTTVVPGLHNEEILVKMAKQIEDVIANFSSRSKGRRLKSATTGEIKWFLQNFRPKNCLDPEFEKIKPFAKEQLEDFLKAVRKIIPQTELRGV